MHPAAEHSPLGKSSEYISTYTPSLLFPIPRAAKWAELGLSAETLPYVGVDFWTCFELSWLLPSGKPVVAIAEFCFAADSPNIVESKSFKLYLNSLNQTVFADTPSLEATLRADLSAASGKPVSVRVRSLDEVQADGVGVLPGVCIDGLDITVSDYAQPRPELLKCDDSQVVEESVYSHRPRKPAALPCELSQPQRVSRAVRGTHLHGHHAPVPADEVERLRALHAPRRTGHQPLAQQLQHRQAARQSAQRAPISTGHGRRKRAE